MIKSYLETSQSGKIQWELQQVILDEKRVKQAFQIRSDYQTTDYADIGDNESDPFLLKMINLGHLNHSHSGFITIRDRHLAATIRIVINLNFPLVEISNRGH